MGSINYRVVYIGDEEGEIEFMNYLKDGWSAKFDNFGKLIIMNNMAVVFKSIVPRSA